MLDFLYTSLVQVAPDRLLELARVADFFGLLEMRALCYDHALSGLEVDNAADMFAEADCAGLHDLKEQSKEVILWDYSKVVSTPGFNFLSCAQLKDILKHDELRVRKEEDVFESLVAWLESNPNR